MNTFVPDKTDLALIDALQDDIPLVEKPWEAIGKRLAIPEEEVMRRLQVLEEVRIIRGIVPVLDSGRMVLNAATLVALRVPEDRVQEIAEIIGGYPEVSHNYLRDHPFNIWFTIAAKDEVGVNSVLSSICERTGLDREDILNLPTVRRFKIHVRFTLPENHPKGAGYGRA